MTSQETAQKSKKPPKIEELDLDPDAWLTFEKLAESAAKLGPQSHKAHQPRRKQT